MMIVFCVLAILAGSNVVFGMENKPDFNVLFNYRDKAIQLKSLENKYRVFEDVVPIIKSWAKDDSGLNTILNDSQCTKHLLYFIDDYYLPRSRFKNGFDCSIRNARGHLRMGLAVLVLGTPGAIEFGKTYIAKYPQKVNKLKQFMFNIVGYSQNDSIESCLSWPEEDVDVVEAGLAIMGKDALVASSWFRFKKGEHLLVVAARGNKIKVVELLLNGGVDKEAKSIYETIYIDNCGWNMVPNYTQRYTALYAAAADGSQDTVDLLLQRRADINTIDTYGRTPLIIAAMNGHVEIVKKLITAKAKACLPDVFNKTALDYAQECLSKYKNNNEKKKKYEAIIQLLKVKMMKNE